MLTNLTCVHTLEKTNVGIPNTCTVCTVTTVLSNVLLGNGNGNENIANAPPTVD